MSGFAFGYAAIIFSRRDDMNCPASFRVARNCAVIIFPRSGKMVGGAGLEPAATGLKVRCSTT